MNVEHRNKNAVALACDVAYAPYAFFLAAQLAQQNPSRDFDICIFSIGTIEVPSGLSSYGIEILPVPPEAIAFAAKFSLGRHGIATFVRLVMPEIMSGRYNRLAYLDCDLFIDGGKFSEMFSLDLKNAPVGAVRDHRQWRSPRKRVKEFSATKLPAAPYFNAGVLLVDVNRFNSSGIFQAALSFLSSHPEAVVSSDQSILNLALHRSWTEISPVWNWQYTWTSRFFADLTEPRITHFIGSNKPWRDSQNRLPRRYRSAYLDFAKLHYPDEFERIATVDPEAISWPSNLGRSFLKHAWVAGRMKDFLSRFPDRFTTYATSELP